jgi:glutamate transport system ATP-binding protein
MAAHIDTPTRSDAVVDAERTTAPLVSLRGVNKYFGQAHVLKDIDLDVHPGEVVVVVGPSGSGKSTMIRAINRLDTITSGEITFDGRPIPCEGKELVRLRSGVGMVFQSFNLFAHMSILDNITLGPIKVSGLSRKQARAEAHTLLERVGIAEQANKLPSQLSGGQQQRAAIARSLAMKPKMVLFDEPTSALDPEMIKEVLDVMRGLANDGMTMIVVTHEMGFARSAANRVVFMDQGSIIETTGVADFFPEPHSERARDFLSKIINH